VRNGFRKNDQKYVVDIIYGCEQRRGRGIEWIGENEYERYSLKYTERIKCLV
jgi:hypothetical protein